MTSLQSSMLTLLFPHLVSGIPPGKDRDIVFEELKHFAAMADPCNAMQPMIDDPTDILAVWQQQYTGHGEAVCTSVCCNVFVSNMATQ